MAYFVKDRLTNAQKSLVLFVELIISVIFNTGDELLC